MPMPSYTLESGPAEVPPKMAEQDLTGGMSMMAEDDSCHIRFYFTVSTGLSDMWLVLRKSFAKELVPLFISAEEQDLKT